MQNRYLVHYVGDDSHDHIKVVWAVDHKEAVAKVHAQGGEMVRVVKRLMSPLSIFGIGFVLLVLVGLLIYQMI